MRQHIKIRLPHPQQRTYDIYIYNIYILVYNAGSKNLKRKLVNKISGVFYLVFLHNTILI